MATQSIAVDKIDISHVEKHIDTNDAAKEEGDYSGSRSKTTPEEIALVRTVDWILLPTVCLDRNAITIAALDGIVNDLNLTDVQYRTCLSILFVGYIIGQIPSNMLITRLRPSWYMATLMALWSVASTLTAITHDYKGLLLCRFFLGITEAPFYPGVLYIFSIFYTKKEISTRISILFTANICGTAFAGLIAIGCFKLEGVAGLAGWRWLFIIQGVASFAVAILSVFVLPDEPLRTRWLNESQRQLAHDRIAMDTVQIREDTTTWVGLRDALKDYKLWLLMAAQHLKFAAASFKQFFPTVVNTLGFGRNATLALTCPPYIISGIVTLAFGWSSGHFNERTWHITASQAVAIVGFIVACSTLNTGARYFAMCLFTSGVYAPLGIGLGWVSAVCGQTREKKSVSLALVNAVGSVAPIWTPYLWPDSDAPRYTIAMGSSAAFCVAAGSMAWALKLCLIKENRKIRQRDPTTTMLYPY